MEKIRRRTVSIRCHQRVESLWLTNSTGSENKSRSKRDDMTSIWKVMFKIMTNGEMQKAPLPILLMIVLAQKNRKKPLMN